MGMQFDPFCALNAADDPHLSEYLVGHEIFSHLWGDWISWLFARPGGGKTALRLRTAQACWVGQETNRPFPISYIPPLLSWGHVAPTLDDHLAALSRSGATALLLALAYRPHWLLRLDNSDRRQVREVLDCNLPGPLNLYLARCRQSQSVQSLREVLDPTFAMPDPPDAAMLLQWCDILEAIPDCTVPLPPAMRWERFKNVILEILNFRTLYILIDGLDAAPETSTDARKIAELLSPLLLFANDWATQKVFLKGFLPLDTQEFLQSGFNSVFTAARMAAVDWTPALLAEVIRRRVYVASRGAFGSLDAVASPAVRDIETVLAKAVSPLPREMLVLIHRMLEIHVDAEGVEGQIQERDMEQALQWYRGNQPAKV
jgi:hypothetical protein